MIMTINKTDNYKLRLNIKKLECMDDMFSFTLESQLITSKSPTEYQTVFSTTVDRLTLAELQMSLDTYLFMEN
jgi:hypothetical protein